MEKAMRWQLDEALGKSRQALDRTSSSVQDVAAIGQQRLQVLPPLDFAAFDSCLTAFKNSRQKLDQLVRDSQGLHHDMERQLLELKTAKPSSVDETSYKERLVNAERLYMEVKSQRETLAGVTTEASQKNATAEASSAALKRATDEVRKLDDEISAIRLKKAEKETEATKLRHKANTPNLLQMKEQAEQSLERNAQQAKELQIIGQRVNQGDPDYLKEGESRESKIAQLAAQLSQLKKQHQQLLLQQKEYDFSPADLNNKADSLTNEAMELQNRMLSLEGRRLEADRERSEKTGQSSRDIEDARAAQERRTSLSSRLQLAESQVRSEMSALQPMIQEHHAGWQRLLSQQKKLESDNNTLTSRLAEAREAADREASTRTDLGLRLQGLVTTLQSFQLYLDEVAMQPAGGQRAAPLPTTSGAAPSAPAGLFADDDDDILASPPAPAAASAVPAAAPAAPAVTPTATNVFADGDDDFLAEPPQLIAPPVMAPALVTPPAAEASALVDNIVDDFDAFLKEDIGTTFAPPSATSPTRTADAGIFEDDILAEDAGPTAAPAAPVTEVHRSPEPAPVVAAAPPATTVSTQEVDDIFDEL
jgi:hypothetical protein